MTIKYYANSTGSEKLEEVDEEERLMWQSEHKQRSNYNHEDEEDFIEEEEEEENEDDELMIEDASSMSSSPSIPDEDINFDLVYALHTFVATVEGQASVVKGDALILMEDTNIYWWLVEVLKTREVGYIPAENIETPYERLARLNKHRNVEITSPSIHDIAPPPSTAHPLHTSRKVTIGDELCLQVFEYEVESDYEDEEEDGSEDIMEEEEDTVEHEKIQIQNKSSEFQEMTYDHSEDMMEHKQPEWQETNWEDDSLSTTTAAAMAAEISPLEVVPKEEEPPQQKMDLRVFAGNIGQGPLFHTFSVLVATTADDLIKTAVDRFNVMQNIEPSENTTIEYYLAVQGMDGDEYILSAQDKPYSIFKTLTDSLTTPMPSLTHIKRISQQSISSNLSTSSRRPRSSSFSNYEETSYGEDSVIRFYLHRRIKRAVEREGLIYIKVSLYPDETSMTTSVPLPAISSHAFIKNPTTPSLRLNNKKSRQQQQKQKSEIDRIDKIISVRKEHPIGVVINLALEKFHVPDAQADDYFEFSNGQGDNSRQLGKYRMSIRSNHQETDLNPNQIMSNVLLEQQNSTPNYQGGPITSDLLFVLRKAGKTGSQKSRHTSHTGNKLLPSQLLTSNISITAEDRRPSILDILMDNTPRFTGERRPSVMSSLLDPLPPVTTRFAEDNNNNNNNNRRPSGQERKSSLNNINTAQQQSPSTTSSSSSFPISKSPPHRRSSIQSSSILSSSTLSLAVDTNNHELMDNQITPTSSSSIMTKSMQQTPSASTSTEVYKRKESLKQQFKRFVGWGSPTPSSSSSSSKKSIPPPLTTTGMESPSDMSFVSAPSTPLPPTPSTPRSFTTKSRQGSQQLLLHGDSKLSNMEVNESVISTTPAEVEVEPSAAAIAVTQAIVNNNRLSTVSSVSSVSSNSSTSSVTSEEIAEATKKGLEVNSESDDEVDNESIADVKSSTATLPEPPSEEPEDIQAQYALWMNSQPPNALKEETVPNAAFISKALPPLAVAAVPPTSPIPARNPLRNKSSTISNNTNTTVSQSTAPSIISTTTTVVTTMANPKEETLHPMPAVNHGGQQDLDDLFLLVAHGVDFLTTRENTKWEEEGGYEFHPWNRPQSSFAVKHEQQRKDKDMPPLPIREGGEMEEDVSSGGSTSEALAMARSLLLSPISPSQPVVIEEEQVEEEESNKPISPPLTPLPQLPAQDQQQQQQEALSLAKRILSGKNEAQTVAPSFAQPSQQSVDDEELQRIVASHIVF